MPELRQDALTGRTVLIAENRAHRPNEFAAVATSGAPASAGGRTSDLRKLSQPNCPFCRGNEAHTPPSVYQATGDAQDWRVRVVTNKFPAVELGATVGADNPALGAHEVVIEAPEHVERMSDVTSGDLAHVLGAYRQRLWHWRQDGRFRYGLLFKNQGAAAGASLAHVHSQLVALPDIPAVIQRELHQAAAVVAEGGQCAYCRLCKEELAHGERVVLHRDGFVAFCPYASLQPFEVWLLPATHSPWFEQPLNGDDLAALADVLHALLTRLEQLVPSASYNMLLRTTPWDAKLESAGHWRIEILPRFNPLAGLELATGIHINPVPPERAAASLRA